MTKSRPTGPRKRHRLAIGRTNDRGSVSRRTPELVIRRLEEIDARRVVDMTYKVWFIGMAKTMAIENIRMMEFLIVNVITSLVAYVISQSVWIAVVWFLAWPVMGYMYTTVTMGSSDYNRADDTRPGSDFFEYWSRSDRYMLVAELGDKLVGSISVINVSPTHAIVTRIVVDLGAVEQDVGIRLLSRVVSACDKRQIERLDLITSYPKKHSFLHDLYTEMGFVLLRTFYKGHMPFFKVPFYRYCRQVEFIPANKIKEGMVTKTTKSPGGEPVNDVCTH